MVARIAFAIATITKPDILIADEILSVGDFLFQQKCEQRMQELMSGGTTVILVSHSIEQVERMCNKVAWLDHGHLRMNGPTAQVCEAYKKFAKPLEQNDQKKARALKEKNLFPEIIDCMLKANQKLEQEIISWKEM